MWENEGVRMSRTIQEMPVYGRSYQDIRNEILRWMNDNKVKLVEERQDFMKGRIGVPGGLGLTAPKYFEIYFKPIQGGMIVHTEGFIGVYGVSEQDFAPKAVVGGIPRRQGWRAIEDLGGRLRSMSTGMPQAQVPAPAQPVQYPCPKCGQSLSFIQQYQKWYCYNCQKYSDELKTQESSPKEGEKRFCIFCGAELPAEATFCTNCGKKQEIEEKAKVAEKKEAEEPSWDDFVTEKETQPAPPAQPAYIAPAQAPAQLYPPRVPPRIKGRKTTIAALIFTIIGSLLFFVYSRLTLLLLIAGSFIGIIGLLRFKKSALLLPAEDKNVQYGMIIIITGLILVIASFAFLELAFSGLESATYIVENEPYSQEAARDVAGYFQGAINNWVLSSILATLAVIMLIFSIMYAIKEILKGRGGKLKIFAPIFVGLAALIAIIFLSLFLSSGINVAIDDMMNTQNDAELEDAADEFIAGIKSLMVAQGVAGILLVISLGLSIYQFNNTCDIAVLQCPTCGLPARYVNDRLYCHNCKQYVQPQRRPQGQPPAYAPQQQYTCMSCGGTLSYVYDRWYCYNCKQYK